MSRALEAVSISSGRAVGAVERALGIAWERDWPLLALTGVAVLMCVPLWCVHAPAMPDYPAHLADFFLLAGGGKHDPFLSAIYRIHWAFVPNLASEVIIPLLAQVFPLEFAAKLFLTVSMILWVLGPAAIARALYGRIGIAPLFSAFFAYNANLMWGFMNYYFAAGVAMLLFALWIMKGKKLTPAVLASFAAAASLLYFCHLFALALLGLLIGAYELTVAFWERRLLSRGTGLRAVAVLGMFVPSAIAYLFLKPSDADGSRFEFNLWMTRWDRIGAAIQYHFDNPANWLLLVLAVLLVAGIATRKLTLHKHTWPVIAAVALCAMFAPEWAFGGWACNLRLPAVLGALVFAAADIHLPRRAQMALAGAAVVVLSTNAAVLAANWRGYDKQFAEFRSALQSLNPGVKMVTVLDSDAMEGQSDQPYWHMAEFGIVDTSAFTPLMFTTKGQHVVRLQPAYQKIAAASAQQGSPPDASELWDLQNGMIDDDPDIRDVFPYLMYYQCHFDEMVVIHDGGTPTAIPDNLKLRVAGSFFSLYDIHPTKACNGK